ncbi:MAG: hypothetical protein ABSF95_19740 [Verrucomicrobiota bacterium]
MPNDLHVVLASELPAGATWYCLRHWQDLPPSPFNWCAGRTDVSYYVSPSLGAGIVFADDPALDAALEPSSSASAAGLGARPLDDGGPPPPGGGGGGGGGGGAPPPVGPPPGYQPGDIWLQIFPDTNNVGMAQLLLHGVTNSMYYQLLSKTNLIAPWLGGWVLGEVQWGGDWCNTNNGYWTNYIWFTPVVCTNPPNDFFRAVGGSNEAYLSLTRYQNSHAIEPDQNGQGGTNAQFSVNLYPAATTNLRVYYSTSGTAINGSDYTNCPGSVVMAAGASSTNITVIPLHDGLVEFDEFAVFTLVQTNGYVVDPTRASVTITISDNFGSNIFNVVATNQWAEAVGIDYFAPSNWLVLSVNLGSGSPCNFALLSTNNPVTNRITRWSGVSNVASAATEVKIATAKYTTNGLAKGDLLFGNCSPGGIGWVSSNGAQWKTNWATLTNETNYWVAGDLYVDQTGIWSNDVLAVTGYYLDRPDPTSYGSRGVWRVHPPTTNATQITRIAGYHLEGLLTLSNNVDKYGPWAGKLLTGDECQKLIYAIDTNGAVQTYGAADGLDISPDTFRLIPTNQDLYCCANVGQGAASLILKLSRQWFKNYVGDILIVQSGEVGMGPPALYIVHCSTNGFNTKTILLTDPFMSNGWFFEKAAFAPVDIPAYPP